MYLNLFRPISSQCTRFRLRFYSYLSCSPMTDDACSISTSRLIRLRSGPRSKSAKRFPSTAHQSNLLRDRDRIYGYEFRKQLEVMDIEEVLGAPRSPWQRAYVERVIGSIRRECLDSSAMMNHFAVCFVRISSITTVCDCTCH